MVKHMLTPEQHIEEMNRCLWLHSDYQKGMAFVAFPHGQRVVQYLGIASQGLLASWGFTRKLLMSLRNIAISNSDGVGSHEENSISAGARFF